MLKRNTFTKKQLKARRGNHTYDVAAGDYVELTIVGRFDGNKVSTMKESYFYLPAGNRQVDPDVMVTKYEQKKGKHGIYE
jgi:hypothetical protein